MKFIFLAFAVVFTMSVFRAEACVTFPPPKFKLQSASFAETEFQVTMSENGTRFHVDDTFMYTQNSQFCYSKPKETTSECVKASPNEIKILSRDKKNTIGVIEQSGQDFFVWSVDQKGKIDKTKPYLKLQGGVLEDRSVIYPKNVKVTGKVTAYKGGNQIGEYLAHKDGKLSSDGIITYVSTLKSISLPTNEPVTKVLNLEGHTLEPRACADTIVKPFTASRSGFRNSNGGIR